MLTAGILTTSGKKKILDLLDLLGLETVVTQNMLPANHMEQTV